MIINCESCKTSFRLDESRLKGRRIKVRCSKCGHEFKVNTAIEETELIDIDLPEQGASRSRMEDIIASTPSMPEPPKAKKKSRLLRRLLIALLVITAAGAGAYALMNSRTTITQSPAEVQGKTTASETKPPVITILDSTQAYFLENSHVGQIFVVEGEVANESSKPVSFILLEGKLYTRNNKVAQSQKCYSGNFMSKDELIKLNITDIQNRMMNREGKDLMNVHVPTSKRTPFMLVFHNLPDVDALSDYSVEVVSAQFD